MQRELTAKQVQDRNPDPKNMSNVTGAYILKALIALGSYCYSTIIQNGLEQYIKSKGRCTVNLPTLHRQRTSKYALVILFSIINKILRFNFKHAKMRALRAKSK